MIFQEELCVLIAMIEEPRGLIEKRPQRGKKAQGVFAFTIQDLLSSLVCSCQVFFRRTLLLVKVSVLGAAPYPTLVF